jgi:hypothetical protein
VVEPRPSPVWGWATILIGLYPVAMALGIVPSRDESLHAPVWVGVLAGSVFVVAGVTILLGPGSRLTGLLAAALCLGLAAIGAWVSLFASSGGMSGGIPFAPRGVNVALGRVMFGGGAVFALLLAGLAARQALSSPARRRPRRPSGRDEA